MEHIEPLVIALKPHAEVLLAHVSSLATQLGLSVNTILFLLGCLLVLIRDWRRPREEQASADAKAFLRLVQSRPVQVLDEILPATSGGGASADVAALRSEIAELRQQLYQAQVAVAATRETLAHAESKRAKVDEATLDSFARIFSLIAGDDVQDSPVRSAIKEAFANGMHAVPQGAPEQPMVPQPFSLSDNPVAPLSKPTPPPVAPLGIPVTPLAGSQPPAQQPRAPFPQPVQQPLFAPQVPPDVPHQTTTNAVPNSGPFVAPTIASRPAPPPVLDDRPVEIFVPKRPGPSSSPPPAQVAPVRTLKTYPRPSIERPKPQPIQAATDPFAAARQQQ